MFASRGHYHYVSKPLQVVTIEDFCHRDAFGRVFISHTKYCPVIKVATACKYHDSQQLCQRAEGNELALSLLNKEDAFIHPFDDTLFWEGHVSMIDEIVAEGLRPDTVILSVGGGIKSHSDAGLIQASQLIVKIGVAKTGVTIDSVSQAAPIMMG